MRPREELAAIADNPFVQRVPNDRFDGVLVEPVAADLLGRAITRHDLALLRSVAAAVRFVCDQAGRLRFDEPLEGELHDLGFALVRRQRLGFGAIVEADRHHPSVPQSPLSPSGHLAERAFASQLPLILGEAQQNVEHQHACGSGRIELLGCRRERHLVFLQELPEVIEVLQ
ncbi:hypothetical protein [Candidatus Amarobacter glycogenicus]|uniref:hypothetical protein n=1 Tax=Candidatus Amarobacter glycogenicus TaxID=3140699 RepID=UPI0031CC6581